MKKRTIVPIAAALVLAFALLFPRFWARHRALEYLEEKYNKSVVYGEVIRVEDVTVDKIQANVFTGQYSVLMKYDDVLFEVYNGNDTYTERYLGHRYAGVMRSGDMKELVQQVGIVLLNAPTGAAALEKTDVKFQMTLGFQETFATKEAYAAAVRKALERLEEAGLTACDLLETFGYVGEHGLHMTCSVSPMWEEPTDAEILARVSVFPS